MSRRICSASSAGRKPSMTISGALGIGTLAKTRPAASCHFHRGESIAELAVSVRGIVYYGYSFWISGFKRAGRIRMQRTRHSGHDNPGAWASRYARWLAVLAAITAPSLGGPG